METDDVTWKAGGGAGEVGDSRCVSLSRDSRCLSVTFRAEQRRSVDHTPCMVRTIVQKTDSPIVDSTGQNYRPMR